MSADEGDTGTQTLSFTISLVGGVSAGDITIPYTLGGSEASGGTASDANRDFTWPTADYDSSADSNQGRGSVRIPAGDASVSLDFEIIGDTVAEGDENIVVTLLSPATPGDGAGVATRAADAAAYRATGTIRGDDGAHTFSLNCPDPADATMTAALTESASGTGPVCTVTYASPGVNLALNAPALLTWTVDHTGGALVTSAADFAGGAEALSGDVTIPAGSTGDGSAANMVEFTLPRAVADSVSEAAETFTVALSPAPGRKLAAHRRRRAKCRDANCRRHGHARNCGQRSAHGFHRRCERHGDGRQFAGQLPGDLHAHRRELRGQSGAGLPHHRGGRSYRRRFQPGRFAAFH